MTIRHLSSKYPNCQAAWQMEPRTTRLYPMQKTSSKNGSKQRENWDVLFQNRVGDWFMREDAHNFPSLSPESPALYAWGKYQI